MRIGIGALAGTIGGPATYARELVSALARRGQDEIVVFTDAPDAFAGMPVRCEHVPLRRAWEQVTWDHVRLPGALRAARCDVYHGTKAVLPWRLPVPAVLTVHDLAVYACPETFSPGQRLHFRLCVPPSVARARRIVAVSEHARGDMLARWGLDPSRVVVVPNGVGAAYLAPPAPGAAEALRRARGLGERLVACVGTIQPRKHVERVIEAFVRADAAARGWELAVAGRLRPGHRPAWLDALPAGVHWLGPLPDDALRALYAASAIAMSASDYEGFGLTVAEAMASGCAVIAVGVTSIPEVVGDAGLLVPRSDAVLLGDALAALLTDDARRAAIAEAGRCRAQRFTWDAAAAATRAVYAAAVAEGRGR